MVKRLMTGVCFALIAVFALPSVSSAKPVPGKIFERQVAQKASITRGVNSGKITRVEAKFLRTEQRRISNAKRKMLRDGRLSQAEQKRLGSMQKRAQRHIVRAKTNTRRR